MSNRQIVKDLEEYVKARIKICEQVANYGKNEKNIEFLQSQRIIETIFPLISDPQFSVRLNAINCFSRMCNQSAKMATKLLEHSYAHILLREMLMDRNRNPYFKKAALQGLTRVAKHSEHNAKIVADAGGLSAFLVCMEEENVAVKEAAVCGLGVIITKSAELALQAVSNGAATLLAMYMQHHELSLKNVAAMALSDLASHSSKHAHAICNAGGLLHLSRTLNIFDSKLKHHCLKALANVASHTQELAEFVIEARIFPRVLMAFSHECKFVRKQAVRVVQEIVKHSFELAQFIVTSGGVGALVQVLSEAAIDGNSEEIVTSAAMAVGYIAGQGPQLALSVVECKGVQVLEMVLSSADSGSDEQVASCVWAIGHLGKHTPQHSKAIFQANIVPRLIQLYTTRRTQDNLNLHNKCYCTLKMVIQSCLSVNALQSLLYQEVPVDILKFILEQISKILTNDAAAIQQFLVTGGWQKVQEIAITDNALEDLITEINSCYPEDTTNQKSNNPSTVAETE